MSTHAPRTAGTARPRRCRLATAAALVAGLMLVLAVGAAALPQPPHRYRSVSAPRCTLKGAKTIKANRNVRVFKVVNSRGFGRVLGCRRSARRARELGFVGECQNNDEIRLVELAGRRAALGVHECSLTTGWWTIALVHLGSGRSEYTAYPLGDPASDLFADQVVRLAVTADGAVAWTARRTVRGALAAVEVRRRRRGTTNQSITLDSGTGIDPDSLRRRGHVLSWRKDGVRRTARI